MAGPLRSDRVRTISSPSENLHTPGPLFKSPAGSFKSPSNMSPGRRWTLVEYSDGRPPQVFRAESFGSEDLQNWFCYWSFGCTVSKKDPHLLWVMVRRIQDLPVDFLTLYTIKAPTPVPFRSSFVLHMNEKGEPAMLQAQGITPHGHLEYRTIPFEKRSYPSPLAALKI